MYEEMGIKKKNSYKGGKRRVKKEEYRSAMQNVTSAVWCISALDHHILAKDHKPNQFFWPYHMSESNFIPQSKEVERVPGCFPWLKGGHSIWQIK